MQTTILKAGAGAGKTTTLIRLFEDVAMDFYRAHGRFPKIVLTTFTRKATQEIRERLLSEALKKDQTAMFRYINQRSKVHISTIHGVLSLYLTQFGKELGLAPEFQLVDGSEIQFRQKRILRKLLLENSDYLELVEVYEISSLLMMLDQYYQQHFLNENLAPIGAGELLKLSRQILEKICREGFKYFEQISAYEISDSWKEYFAPFANLKNPEEANIESLKEFFTKLGRKPPFNKRRPAFDESLHDEFKNYIDESKKQVELEAHQESFIERHQYLAEKFRSLADDFCRLNLKERLESSVLGMSDLEALSLRLIRQFPWTAKKFAAQWDYWMIDEYQDTSPLQVELLQHLVGGRPHFVVGDPQQSIYLFRGARSDVFNSKMLEIENSGGQVRSALTNYRSNAPLLEFINSYFSGNPSFTAMVPFKTADTDACAEALILDGGDDAFETEKKAILGLIQEKLANGVPAQEICVLSRTNRILEELSRMAFKAGVPVQLHSAGGFSSRREVLDFLCIIKFLVNPHDNLNFLSVLRSPWFHLEDSKILNLNEKRPHKVSVWNFWNQNLKSFEKDLLDELNHYRDLAEAMGLSETMGKILSEKALIDWSKSLDPSGRREANLWKIFVDLKTRESLPGFNPLQFVDDYENRPPSQDESDATPVVEPDRVNLMTIHASKGLQFGHVIIAGFGNAARSYHGDWWMLDEKTAKWSLALRGPDQKRLASLWGLKVAEERRKRETEESDRVLYVAMTRAKEFLSFVWCLGPRKGSWASSFPFATQEGTHRHDKFSFCVRTKLSENETSLFSDTETVAIRKPYKENFQTQEDRRIITSNDLKFVLEGTKRAAAFHKLFKALKFRPEIWHEPSEEFSEALSFVKGLKEIPIQQILNNGETDWSMTLRRKDQRLRLQLDVLSEVENEAWLVSYKSGSGKDSDKVLNQLADTAKTLNEFKIVAASKINLLVLYPVKKEYSLKTLDFER